ncbi:unnamed protein product, partial [Urochloa humidicola]
MENPVVFSRHDVLAESVRAAGGTELVFVRVSEHGGFIQMRVSFSIPHSNQAELMVAVTAVGEHGPTEVAAEENACSAALHVLQDEHGYSVLDYSIFRVWDCKVRFDAFVEKLQNGRGILLDVLAQSAESFRRIRSTLQYFGRKIDNLRNDSPDCIITNRAAACAVQLELIYEQAMQGHTARLEQIDEINEPGDLSTLLLGAGFHVPANEADLVKLSGALEVILRTVAANLGFLVPEFGMRTENGRFKCYIRFPSSGDGRGSTFTGFGRVALDPVTARQTALYRCLLAFSVNYGVLISDPNRDAYLFCKDRVNGIGSDLVAMADMGTNICS